MAKNAALPVTARQPPHSRSSARRSNSRKRYPSANGATAMAQKAWDACQPRKLSIHSQGWRTASASGEGKRSNNAKQPRTDDPSASPPATPAGSNGGSEGQRDGEPRRSAAYPVPRPEVIYQSRGGDPNGGGPILRAKTEADATRVYWFEGRSYPGRSSPREPLPWSAKSGKWRVTALDDQGRADVCNVTLQTEP